jgi:mRNA-degrading endonuclease YafQ of YafQ-DinJ toxin-antitoxin module
MPDVPDLAELEATVARMEARYADHPLFADYKGLCERFTQISLTRAIWRSPRRQR